MPIYDYLCPNCRLKKVDVFVHNPDTPVVCIRCHTNMSRLFPVSTSKTRDEAKAYPGTWPEDGVFLEHVSAKGERFHSRKEMKEYATKHDMTIAMLE